MQTRTRSKAAALSDTSSTLPPLPEPVQMSILEHLLASYPEPDAADYILYPFKSTLGWLLSLRLVNKQWSHTIQQHATVAARCRLEALRNLSLLHVYAHFIVTARTYKVKRRNRKVPRKITLNFTDIDGSSCEFTVPRALSKAESSGGLPSHTLMLVACYNALTLPALQQLLADLDCLDQQHAAPMVIKLLTARSSPAAAAAAAAAACSLHASEPPSSSADGNSRADAAVDGSQAAALSHLVPGKPAAAAAATSPPSTPPTHSHTSVANSVEEMIAAVGPLLRQRLVHVVMEGTAASPALYFIPTKNGFHRRLPAAAAAAAAAGPLGDGGEGAGAGGGVE
ncbi:hypothetical protein OEZ85_007660 [Tetradesmus obliquus]|uniref:F-box domain-containing protein n=1 Tax=Tetradesmus obliquus TaxID=3088 RepID=A0ABY8TIT1_TETOB|nr:hypothetical protein OEZ85_007660 [Tetradesmus obliquus]